MQSSVGQQDRLAYRRAMMMVAREKFSVSELIHFWDLSPKYKLGPWPEHRHPWYQDLPMPSH